MTAGQISTGDLNAPHHGARPSRRAVIGSAIVVAGLAVALAVPALVANSGRQAAAVPAAAATQAAAPMPAAVPAAAAPTSVVAPPNIYGPAGPYPVTHERTPARTGTGMPWGRRVY